MNKGFFIVLLLCLTLLQASVIQPTSYRKFPIVYKVTDETPEFNHAVDVAASHWNDLLHFTVFTREAPSSGKSRHAMCTISTFRSAAFGGKSSFTYRTDNPFIQQFKSTVDVAVNRKALYTPKGRKALESILVHELGHVLNIDHSWDADDVMFYKLTNGKDYSLTDNNRLDFFRANPSAMALT